MIRNCAKPLYYSIGCMIGCPRERDCPYAYRYVEAAKLEGLVRRLSDIRRRILDGDEKDPSWEYAEIIVALSATRVVS